MFKPQFLLVGALLTSAPPLVYAQNTPDAGAENRSAWYPFHIPSMPSAQTGASALDLSHLNATPAGANGFLRAQGEKIVDGRGREVRLFGTNVTDYHVMPPKDRAEPMARRLRELGVNFVRLHYFDWGTAPDGLLNADGQTLNPAMLDRFHWFFFHLKQHGIYVDINLHVMRSYPNPPEGWTGGNKSVDRALPRLIESQKQYARDLLTSVNPYTRTAYTDEPAVAFVEINNESSLMDRWTLLPGIAGADGETIRVMWNEWLRTQYQNTTQLRAAWNGEAVASGPELVRNGRFENALEGWDKEASGGAESSWDVQRDEKGAFLKWQPSKKGSASWNHQLHQSSVPLEHGKSYILRLRARTTVGASVVLMQQQEPWQIVGSGGPLVPSAQWRDYEFAFKVNNTANIPTRLSFDTGNELGTLEIADVSLLQGDIIGLHDGESLENGSIPLPRNGRAKEDFRRFALALELDSTRQMTRFLKDELKVRSLVWDTQVNFGQSIGLLRERNSDVVDIHAYPAHPTHINQPDGQTSWQIKNASMLGGARGELESLAHWRVAGKPFFVGEFDLNPPNDHASESYPLLSLMATYQGWSGFGEYDWMGWQLDNEDPGRIWNAYSTAGHPGQIAFMPTSALLFRLGLVRPAQSRATLSVPESLLRENGHNLSQTWREHGVAGGDSWQRALAVQIAGNTPTLGGAVGDKTTNDRTLFHSDTSQITLNRNTPGQETLTVNAPSLRMAFGFTGGKTFTLGDVRFQVENSTRNGYANLSLVALDGQPVARSNKLLLTAVARVENTGQTWNADRTVASLGAGPVLVEPVKFTLTLPAGAWRASVLDGNGGRAKPLPMQNARLQVSQPQSLWYLIERTPTTASSPNGRSITGRVR